MGSRMEKRLPREQFCAREKAGDSTRTQRLYGSTERAQPSGCGVSLYAQILDNLPYPIAVFNRDGFVLMANRTLLNKSGRTEGEVAAGKVNFLDRVVDENYAVFEAVEHVFYGETTVARNLLIPLSLFCQDDEREVLDEYRSAVFFPVPDGKRNIAFGAVMLMCDLTQAQ